MIATIIFGFFAALFWMAAIRQVFADDEVHWKEGMR